MLHNASVGQAGARAVARSSAHSHPPRLSLAGRRQLTITASAEGEGVLDLLSRDRKAPKLAPELLGGSLAAPPAPSTSRQPRPAETDAATSDADEDATTSSTATRSAPQLRGTVKSKRERRRAMARVEEEGSAAAAAAANRPKRCKDAIDAGLALFTAGDYQAAADMFNDALELPGNGAYRLTGSPREYSCPSDAEENACLYNMACCYAQLGQREAALTCIDAILDNGFTDVDTLKNDPDLAPVRGSELQGLIEKYTGIGSKLKGLLPFGNKNKDELVSDDSKNKPWIMW